LQDVRAKINAADIGVTATVVTGSTGDRLILTGKEGAANAFTLAATTTGPGAATNDLADVANFDIDDNDDTLARSTAADALLTIDGVAVTSSGNIVENALNGVSLKLLATGSTTLTVATDNSKISEAVKSLVDAYNAINTLVKENSTYDTATKTAKPLNGESSVRTIQSILTSTRTSIPAALASATYKTLSDIGVSVQKDGSLTIDSAKLTASLTSSSSSVQTTLAAYGTAFNGAIASMLNTGGVLESRVSGLNASIKSYNDRKTTLEFRVENIEKRYRAQFTALDKLVSSMQTTSTYLTQQLSALSK
jgi:flagellar hook-associated protein 2